MSAIDHLSHRMRRLADRRILIASGALCLVLAAVMFGTSGPASLAQVADRCGHAAPDVRFTTSPDEVHRFLSDCGTAGRDAYRQLQLIDLLYPAAVGVFLASALSSVWAAVRSRAGWRPEVQALAALPLLASAFDYAENLAAWTLLARYPEPMPWVARALGLASAAKQSLMWASVATLALGIVLAVAGRLRGVRPVGNATSR